MTTKTLTKLSTNPSVPVLPTSRFQGASTRAVHDGAIRSKPYHSLIEPIVQTSTYTFESSNDVCEYMETH
ncbi:MAG: hypothetical protein WHV66_04835, partial [Anaerolineales bacterium]